MVCKVLTASTTKLYTRNTINVLSFNYSSFVHDMCRYGIKVSRPTISFSCDFVPYYERTHRQTYRQKNRQTDRPTERRIDRQAERERERKTETERDRKREEEGGQRDTEIMPVADKQVEKDDVHLFRRRPILKKMCTHLYSVRYYNNNCNGQQLFLF